MEVGGPGEDRPADCIPLLRRIITESHALLLFENAVFLAERLLALNWGIEAAYWVAQSYFLLGDYSHVFHFLKPLHPFTATFPPCKDFGLWHWRLLHVWGVCCVKLQKHQQAEQVFALQLEIQYNPSPAELAAHHHYMGLVARRLRNNKGATHHFVESYSLNPFLFSAFEEACTTGHASRMDSSTIFSTNTGGQYIEEHMSLQAAMEEENESDDAMIVEGAELAVPFAARTIVTRSATQTLAKKATPAARKAPRTAATAIHRPYPTAPAPPKRSRALSSSSLSRWKWQPGPCPGSEEIVTIAGVQYLLRLLAVMGEAFRLLCLYKCPQCIHTIKQIPAQQSTTGWVLSLLGRAHLELTDYSEACTVFAHLRKLEPYRLEGMVEYSTALYQLKKDKDLAALGQSMADQDRYCSHTLCVLANCFSLTGEHEAAIRFLKRAAKQTPFMWYTRTLLGHEHFILDDIDAALQQYRHAMLINPLHFNAWYGMGQVYMKQEQYVQAQHYFSAAIKLNSNSSPLHVHLAMTLQNQEKYREALENLQTAITIQPTNLLARLRRAQLNLGLNKTAEALQELEFLRDKAPKEAQICITLGKCYQRMGLKSQALHCFNLAMDLQPKENPMLKRYMEQCLQGAGDQP